MVNIATKEGVNETGMTVKDLKSRVKGFNPLADKKEEVEPSSGKQSAQEETPPVIDTPKEVVPKIEAPK